jgi:hypothetical protein
LRDPLGEPYYKFMKVDYNNPSNYSYFFEFGRDSYGFQPIIYAIDTDSKKMPFCKFYRRARSCGQ